MMNLFVYTGSVVLDLEKGKPINEFTSAMWVERYRDPGEFEIVAPLSSGLKDLLPIGAIVSHTDTYEFCIVENHEINESLSDDPVIRVTGRSFDAFLETRITGLELSIPSPNPPYQEYQLASAYSYAQAEQLLTDHIGSTYSSGSLLPYVRVEVDSSLITSPPGTTQDKRNLQRETVHSSLVKILSIDDLGIKTIRKNPFGVIGSSADSKLMIHQGQDVSNSVIFSWATGELESVSYLISNKTFRNAALVHGTWVEEYVYPSPAASGYDLKWILVDGKDIDESYSSAPTGTDLTDVRSIMSTRGSETLSAANDVNIVAADISKLNQYRYRTDYNIGDIVSIDGSYGDIELRRVVEHVEIEDETGDTSYPTLAYVE